MKTRKPKNKGAFKIYKNGCGEFHVHIYVVDGLKGYVWEVNGPTDDWYCDSGTEKTIAAGLTKAVKALRKALKIKEMK